MISGQRPYLLTSCARRKTYVAHLPGAAHRQRRIWTVPTPPDIVVECSSTPAKAACGTIAMVATEGVVRGMNGHRHRRRHHRARRPRPRSAVCSTSSGSSSTSSAPSTPPSTATIHRSRARLRRAVHLRGDVRGPASRSSTSIQPFLEGRQDRPLRRRRRRQDRHHPGVNIINVATKHGGFSVFAGVGERAREGNDLWIEFQESGVIDLKDFSKSKAALHLHGQMIEPPGAFACASPSPASPLPRVLPRRRGRRHAASSSSTTSSASPYRPAPRSPPCSAACPPPSATSPTSRDRDGRATGAHHVDQERFGDFGPGRLRSRRRPHRPRPRHHLFRPFDGHHRALPSARRSSASTSLVDPLASTSRILTPAVVGQSTTTSRRASRRILCSAIKTSRTSSPSPASTSSEEDKTTVARARKVQRFPPQFFHVAEIFTGISAPTSRSRRRCAASRRSSKASTTPIPEQAFLPQGWH